MAGESPRRFGERPHHRDAIGGARRFGDIVRRLFAETEARDRPTLPGRAPSILRLVFVANH
jgi:hypothetical protein